MSSEYEVTLVVGRVKEEHVTWTLMVLNEAATLLSLDGTDLNIVPSVERDRDGVERFAEFYDDERTFTNEEIEWLVRGITRSRRDDHERDV